MTRAAFFDVDYTLISKSSMMLYSRYMKKAGEYSNLDLLFGLYYLARYKLGWLDMDDVMGKVSVRYRGKSESHMIEVCERWFDDEVRNYLYPEAVELIESHRKRGDTLCLLSAVTVYLARPLSRHLQIEHYLCNRLKVENGMFTGDVHWPLCYGNHKLDYARQFEAETGIRLQDSCYYSDSITDLETMAAFGEPVAVNPDPRLKREAQKRGWKILEFKAPPAALAKNRNAVNGSR